MYKVESNVVLTKMYPTVCHTKSYANQCQ